MAYKNPHKNNKPRELAFEMYACKGMYIRDIAKSLKKDPKTIHQWKKEDNWDEKHWELLEETRQILTPEEIEKYVPHIKHYLAILHNLVNEAGKFSTGKESIFANAGEVTNTLKFVSSEYQRLNVWQQEIIRHVIESKTSVNIKQEYTLTGDNLKKAYEICKRLDTSNSYVLEGNTGEPTRN